MEKRLYPAVFTPAEDGGYTVDFPDLLGCVTEGDNLVEATEMAEDALGLYLSVLKDDKEAIPDPSAPNDVKKKENEFVSMIMWDEEAYLRKTDNKAVKKTLTIPAWLDTMAKAHNINFSNALQNALRRELNVN